MDQAYLQDLIFEAQNRGGGLILSLNSKPAVVVLTVDRYNQMLNNSPKTSPEESKASGAGKWVLVTGGAGYIGAHGARALLKAGYKVAVLDNLSAGKRENVPAEASFIEGDAGDANLLRDLFAKEKFFAVMHFAASIEVEESFAQPEKYLRNNALATAGLLTAMEEAGVKNFIFSSTCAVYGEPETVPIDETARVAPVSPYGSSKLLAERVIKYFCQFAGMRAVVFRYFNAGGCDFDGAIAPTHSSHLISNVLEVAAGNQPFLRVYGNDYQTADGTCVRDFVHVLDIADAHVLALSNMDEPGAENFRLYNLGSGRGFSVKEVINSASEVLERMVSMEIGPRRQGDPAALVADSSKFAREFGFSPKHSDLETIIKTAWKQMQNAAK